MNIQHPRRGRRVAVTSFWTATFASIAVLAFFILVAVVNAQQGSSQSSHESQPAQSSSKATQKHDGAKGADSGQQGTSGTQRNAQSAQGTAPTTGQSGSTPPAQDPSQGAQQPFVMPDKPMCPCPLATKDPVEPHFQEVCGRCHTPDRITGIKKSGLEWKETIDKMILKGAQVSDEDYDVILGFLVRNFDRVDINWAESGEMVVALGLTPEEAEKIVAYRKEHGDFKDFDSLLKVPGVDVKKLEAKKSSFMFY